MDKLLEYAKRMGATLPSLLFGSPLEPGMASASGSSSSSLPPFPAGKQLGLTPKAAESVKHFRQLIVRLRDIASNSSLEDTLAAIVNEVVTAMPLLLYELQHVDGGM